MFHGHVELLTPFGWGGGGKVLFPEQDAHMSSPQLQLVGATYASTP